MKKKGERVVVEGGWGGRGLKKYFGPNKGEAVGRGWFLEGSIDRQDQCQELGQD